LNGWKEQWPTPALTDAVNETSITASPSTATELDGAEVQTVAVAAATKKKSKKALTVGTVRKIMMPERVVR